MISIPIGLRRWMVAAALLSLITPALALAQGSPRTLSGGVGKDERVRNPDFSVRIEFAELSGAYLADVSVVVYDADGKTIVDETADGPWFYADLAPGDYRVVAARKDGARQGAAFTVNGGDRQQVIRLVWR